MKSVTRNNNRLLVPTMKAAVLLSLLLAVAAGVQCAVARRPSAARAEQFRKFSNSNARAEQIKKFSSNATQVSDIWSDCSSSSAPIKILALSVTPDPPEKGQKVMADVKMEFMEEVEGGYLTILVKYKNYIPVMNKKKDLCNIPDILQEACPLQAGIHEATLTQKFPSYAPSGTYVGKVVAKDKSGNELMCIKLSFTLGS